MIEEKMDGERMYQIKEGDTLYNISRKKTIPLELLLDANPYVNVYNLQPGDWIVIPRNPNRKNEQNQKNENFINNQKYGNDDRDRYDEDLEEEFVLVDYVVSEGDTLKKVLEKFDADLEDVLKYNGMNAIILKQGGILKIPRKIDDYMLQFLIFLKLKM